MWRSYWQPFKWRHTSVIRLHIQAISGIGNLFQSACQNWQISLAKFFLVPIDSWQNISERVITFADVQFSSQNQVKSKKKVITSANFLLLSPQKIKRPYGSCAKCSTHTKGCPSLGYVIWFRYSLANSTTASWKLF